MKNSTKLASRFAVLCGAALFATTTLANGSLTNPIETTPVDIENELDQVDPLVMTVTPFNYNGGFQIRCNGQNSGRVSVSSTGGVSPYTYTWSAGTPVAGGTTCVGLFAGTNTVTCTDAAGTSVTESYTLTQNTPLVASVSATDVLCNGGTATVTTSASGGLSPYSGITMTTVSAGSHSYTVSDANGCRSVMSITVTEPDVLVASAAVSAPILCYGETGDITVDAVGGTLPYTGADVIAKSAGSHNFTVTDANGCTASTSAAISQPGELTVSAWYTPIGCYGELAEVTISVVSGTEPYAGASKRWEYAGTYVYDITDYNGCQAQVTMNITQPDMIMAAAEATVVDCNNGTATVSVSGSGGIAPYTGTGLFSGSVGVNTNYTVTDSKGCTADVAYLPGGSVMKANVTPTYYMLDCMPVPVLIEANPTDGVAPYTYLWSTGETTSSITVSPNVTTTYDVTITDANGCVISTNGDGAVVDVINRCGNNNQKIVICHVPSGEPENGQTICISANALDPHMSDAWNLHGGDYCGPCQTSMSLTMDETNNGDNNFISVGMNTNNETVELSYRLAYDSDVRVEIYDMTGALVEMIHQGNATEGQLYDFVVNPSKFTTGVYIYQFITDTERHIDKLHFIH